MPSPLAAGVHDVISTWLHPLRRNERSRALPLAAVAAGITRVQSGMRALQPNCDAADATGHPLDGRSVTSLALKPYENRFVILK